MRISIIKKERSQTIQSNLLLWARSGCPLFRSSYTCFPNSNGDSCSISGVKLEVTEYKSGLLEIAVGIRTGEKKVLRIDEVLKQRESELDELEEQGEIIFWEYK
ncbi:hypothetical protein Peur_054771 [Populus x canadensis]